MVWRIEILDEAKAVLLSLPDDIQARFSRIASLIQEHGVQRMREP